MDGGGRGREAQLRVFLWYFYVQCIAETAGCLGIPTLTSGSALVPLLLAVSDLSEMATAEADIVDVSGHVELVTFNNSGPQSDPLVIPNLIHHEHRTQHVPIMHEPTVFFGNSYPIEFVVQVRSCTQTSAHLSIKFESLKLMIRCQASTTSLPLPSGLEIVYLP